MAGLVERTLHPEAYQGRGKGSPYFEGWYFKIVDASGLHRYAIIPGISRGEDDEGPHSFVQVLNGTTGQTLYQRYPIDAFYASESRLDIQVGPNHFSHQGMEIDLADTELPLQGEVRFVNLQPWPVSVLSPGIMGWYAWVPMMECYHGVLSLDHGLQGILREGQPASDGQRWQIVFDGGRGYIEKDWGAAFPSGWVWMQTNHFRTPGVSLTASIARIPWLGSSFTGFIVGLLWNGTLYRFATYTGAETKGLTIDGRTVHWAIEDSLYRLTLVAHRATTGHLRGPSRTDMGRPVPETLSARVDVELTSRAGAQGTPSPGTEHRLLFAGTGHYAGMEVAGDLATLVP